MRISVLLATLLVSLTACTDPDAGVTEDRAAASAIIHAPEPGEATMPTPNPTQDKIVRSDEEWREILTPEQFRVMRQQGTERAFTGEYWNEHEPGTYVCAACGQELFSSETKFESGTGWPSFYQPLDPASVEEAVDTAHGMVRTEVHCSRCGGHLGHKFPDGPKPTGLRYCLNSASLRLVPDAKAE